MQYTRAIFAGSAARGVGGEGEEEELGKECMRYTYYFPAVLYTQDVVVGVERRKYMTLW